MKKGILKKIVIGALVGVMAFSMAGCGKKGTSVEGIKKAKKLVLGTSADYPPYEFIDKDGKIVGFDVEIAKAIADKLGVELEIKDMKFDGLLAALKTGKIDLVIAGMNPTEERKQSVDFSNIYYTSSQSVVVRAEDKDKYKTLADLKGKQIGVQKATVQEGLAKDQIEGAQLKSLGKLTDVVLELENKKIDAAVMEGPVAKFYIDKNKNLVATEAAFKVDPSETGSAIAVRKDSADFLAEINAVLDQLKKDGKIDQFIIDASQKLQ